MKYRIIEIETNKEHIFVPQYRFCGIWLEYSSDYDSFLEFFLTNTICIPLAKLSIEVYKSTRHYENSMESALKFIQSKEKVKKKENDIKKRIVHNYEDALNKNNLLKI